MFRRGAVMAITVACASFFLIFPASAQSIAEERLSIAREIVELSGATDNMRTMMQSMQPVLREGVRSRGLSEQQADVFVRYFTEEFQGETPRLLEMAAATYADAFSVEELAELRAFWASATGRALRRNQPNILSMMTRAGALIGEQAGLRAAQRMAADAEAQPGGS